MKMWKLMTNPIVVAALLEFVVIASAVAYVLNRQ